MMTSQVHQQELDTIHRSVCPKGLLWIVVKLAVASRASDIVAGEGEEDPTKKLQ